MLLVLKSGVVDILDPVVVHLPEIEGKDSTIGTLFIPYYFS